MEIQTETAVDHQPTQRQTRAPEIVATLTLTRSTVLSIEKCTCISRASYIPCLSCHCAVVDQMGRM